jgi:hypothetical protein
MLPIVLETSTKYSSSRIALFIMAQNDDGKSLHLLVLFLEEIVKFLSKFMDICQN